MEIPISQFIEMFGELGKDQKGWGLTTLGECCELNPKRPRNIDDELKVSFVPMPAISEDGKIDCSNIKTYKEVRKGFTYFAENDVLFAKITPCMENGKGAVAKGLSGGIGSGSTEFHVLRPIEGKSNPYWLYIITMFKSFRVGARKVMTGTGGQLRVPVGYLRDFPISLPPISLQDSFEGFVHQSDKSKFACLKSQFIEMFGDPVDNPKGFEKYPLMKLAKKITDGVHKKPVYTKTGIPFISVTNINRGVIDFTDCKFVSEEAYQVMIKTTYPERGDVLYTKVGATYGISAYVDTDKQFGLYVSVCLIKPKHDLIDAQFLTESMRMEYVKKQADERIKGIGVPDLHLREIKSFEILCPPRELQEQFVEFVKQSDKSKLCFR